MSKYNYIANYYRSAAVNESLVLSLHHAGDRILCMGKGVYLEFYRLEQEELVLFEEIQLSSKANSLMALNSPQGLDSLLALTESHLLYQISESNGTTKNSILNLSVHSRVNAESFKMAKNPGQSLLCISDYLSYLRIMKINNGKVSQNDSFFIDYIKMKNIDLSFTTRNEILIGLFISLDGIQTIVNVYEVLTAEKNYRVMASHSFHERPGRIIQSRSGDFALFLEDSYRVFNAEFTDFTVFDMHFGKIIAKCEVDVTRWVLGNDLGIFYLVLFGPVVDVKCLGHSCSADTVTYLDNNVFFLGSSSDHSKLVKVLLEAESGKFLTEVHDVIGLCPIYDLKVLKNSLDNLNFLASAGTGLGGGFYTITKSVNVFTESQMELANATGLWTISANSLYNTHIIISFYNQTRILFCTDSTIKPGSLPGLLTNEATLLISKHRENFIQVTPTGVFYLSSQWELLFTYAIDDGGKILLTCLFEDTLCIVVKSDVLTVINITEGGLKKLWELKFEWEISCITGFENLIGIGFWVDNSIALLSKETGIGLYKDYFEFQVAAHSAKFVKFENILFFVVGLKDGHLVYYEIQSFKKVSVSIGYQALALQEFSYKGKTFILASCDKSVLLHCDRNKVIISSLNHEKISIASGFNTENFNDCLAIISGKTFSIVSFEDLQKYSIACVNHQVTIMKFVMCDEVMIAITQGINEQYFLKLFNNKHEEVHSVGFDIYESPCCVLILNDRVYVGVNVLGEEKAEKDGFINVYTMGNAKLQLVNRLKLGKCLANLVQVSSGIVVSARETLISYEIISNSLQSLDIFTNGAFIFDIHSLNSLVALTDMHGRIQVHTVSQGKFQLTYQYSRFNSKTTIKILNETLFAVTDSFGNIFLLEPQVDLLVPFAGFSLETTNINCIEAFNSKNRGSDEQRSCFALATCNGDIEVVIGISKEEYLALKALQKVITKEAEFSERFAERERKPACRGIFKKIEEFVNGELVEKYLDLALTTQKRIALQVSDEIGESIDEEKLSNIVFDLSKLH